MVSKVIPDDPISSLPYLSSHSPTVSQGFPSFQVPPGHVILGTAHNITYVNAKHSARSRVLAPRLQLYKIHTGEYHPTQYDEN